MTTPHSFHSTDLARRCRRALESAEGHFSAVGAGAFELDAEPGLVIRVHAGWIWLPGHEVDRSVGVGADEQLVVSRAGTVTVLAAARTHVELQRPQRGGARA